MADNSVALPHFWPILDAMPTPLLYKEQSRSRILANQAALTLFQRDPGMVELSLADIQQPALPDEFYLAPGLLLLALPVLFALVWLARTLYRRYQRDSARRIALKSLYKIQLEHPEAANAILQLLKRYLQTKRPGHGRSETGLHVADQFTLEPGSVSNHQHHHAEDSQYLNQHDCNEQSGCI